MPLKLLLCLGSHKKNHRRNKKLSKLVKVHTDETISIKLSSAGSSVVSVRSFVPSVSLNLKDVPTPPRKDSINEDREDGLIEKQQALPLTVNIDHEIDTTPKKVSPPHEDPLPNKDPLGIENNPSIEDRPIHEDQSSNGDNLSDKDRSFEEDKAIMEDPIPNNDYSPNEDPVFNEDFSTKEDPAPSEEHLSTESSTNVSLESSSSAENEYAQLVCSAVQSEEKQNELLNGVNSTESFMSPLIENLEDMSSSSKTTLASPTVFISAEDVKIISGIHSSSEFAEVLPMSFKEERAEMIEVKWKSPIRVEHVKIEPVEIVEHDNSADYIEFEYDAWVPGQRIDELNIIDFNEYEEFIDDIELEDEAIYNDILNETYQELDHDTYVPGQPTEELKILLTRYDKLNEKIEPDDKTSSTDDRDKTLASPGPEEGTCLPGTPTEDIKVLLSGYEDLNEKNKPGDETRIIAAHDGATAYLELKDNTCAPNQSSDDLEILLTKYDKKFEPEDEASNDDLQNKSDSGSFKHPTKEITRLSFEVAFDTNLSAGDSISPTTDSQSHQTNENFDQQVSSKIEGSEQVFKEDVDVLRKNLTEDSDFTDLGNPIDWCGDYASSVFESENDKKSVSSDRSETEMAEINDLLWGSEEMTTDFPISRRSQLRISERQRKFRNVLQNLIDAQSLPEFQSVFNVNVLREITIAGDSDSAEKKVFSSEVNDSTGVHFSIKETPNSDGNSQNQNEYSDTGRKSHNILNAETLEKNEKGDIIEESKSCDKSVNEIVDAKNLYLRDEEMIDDFSKPENAHVIVSKWRNKFRIALHKLIDMRNSAQNRSTSILNAPTEESDGENTDSDNKNVNISEVINSNNKPYSLKEDIISEGNSCSQNDSPTTEKRSHSILNEEALQLLEESKKKDRTDSSVESDLNDDKYCFKFKRARISETRKQTPKRKVIDQVIESTQKYSSPNCNANKESQNHGKSESSVESKGNVENQESLHSTFQDQNSDSFYYSNLISQNKLKNAIERFVKKAEEYNKMLCNGKTVSSIKDTADKTTQMDIDQTTPRNRSTCADKLIKQFMNKQDGNDSFDSKENSITCEEADEIKETRLSSYDVDDLISTLKERENNNINNNVSCSTSRNTIDPDEQGCIELTEKNSLISVKSSNNEFTLNVNHRNGKRSFECTGDFVLSRGDIVNQSNSPPPLTIHLTSKGNTKNHPSPKKQSADSKRKSSDGKYQNLDPKVVEELLKSQKVFDHFMKEALEPLGPNRRVVPIKRTESLPFTFTFSSIENEKKTPSEKSGNGRKLHARVSPTHSQSSKGKHDRHSPKYVDSPPTSFKTHRRHNNNDILFGTERTSIAKRFLEASNAFKYWRNSLDGDQVLNPFDHGILKTSEGYRGQRGNNLKMKHLEMLHKRHDVMKNKRDIEKMERMEKCLDFSNVQSKSTKGDASDYFGEAFDCQFKRYARKGTPSGDLISYRRSTDWLTDAGIVGTLLTADEANKIFKRLAGVKATLNKQDYKRFLYKLTRVKKISYNEICERLCRCADFPA